MSLDEYWNLNGRQLEKHLEAYKKRKEEHLKEQDFLNHLLGRYIAYAFNDPKKYPKKPFLEKTNKHAMTDEEMEREAMKWG